MANTRQKLIIKAANRDLFEIIFDSLKKNKRVKVTGFGIFELKKVKSRKGYDFRKREMVSRSSYNKIHFIPSIAFKNHISE